MTSQRGLPRINLSDIDVRSRSGRSPLRAAADSPAQGTRPVTRRWLQIQSPDQSSGVGP
jgi:hypothetical protein